MRIPLLLLSILVAQGATAQDIPLRIQSIDAYLMDESYEIALAGSAAPPHVADNAQVIVLRRDGYHQAVAGTNGFTCLVERSWSSPIGLHGDMFNPRLRAPICYNREGAKTVMQEYMRRTELAMAGKSIAEIQEQIQRDIGTGRLVAPRAFAMSYMLSGAQLLGTATGRFKPHLMFYVPYTTHAAMGSPPPGCERVCMFEHDGGPFAAFIVPMAEFIEGPADGALQPQEK